MANGQNLVPRRLTSEEAAELGRKGGKASGEARRAKKTMREYAEFLLSLPVSDGRRYNKLARMGVPPEGIDNKMAVVAALMQHAQTGSVPAAKELRNIIGEASQQDNDALERLDEVLGALNGAMQDDA